MNCFHFLLLLLALNRLGGLSRGSSGSLFSLLLCLRSRFNAFLFRNVLRSGAVVVSLTDDGAGSSN